MSSGNRRFLRCQLRRTVLISTLALTSSLGLAGISQAVGAPDDSEPLPQQAVTALNKLAGGPHPGYRANHAKGVMLTGHFKASKEAAGFSKAGHLQGGKDIPVLVRFSNTTGVPDLPDADPHASPHGMAIRFSLPDKSTTDIVAISASSFPVATPEDFVALLNAIASTNANSPKPSPIEAFMGSHPKAAAWAQIPRPAPVSFGTLEFYGVNAFKFTNKANTEKYGRYQIVPLAGEHALSDADAKAAKPDYLMQEITERVVKKPVAFRLQVQVAEAGDELNDGTVSWPATRKTVVLGTITLDGVVKDQVGEAKKIMFTPLSLVDGIEPSDDPVLLFRPLAYGVSFQQRAQ